jgi:hypothetical protein
MTARAPRGALRSPTFESEPQANPEENRAGQALDPSQSAFEPAA